MEYIHSKGIISKDVAWSNFTMGIGENSNILYMIDFGLAKMYRDIVTKEHMPYRDGLINPGAPRFISQNAHLGIGKFSAQELGSSLKALYHYRSLKARRYGITGVHPS